MKTVVLNGSVINYDGKMDYASIDENVVVYEKTSEDKILERIQDCDIVVTKTAKKYLSK